MTIVLGIETSCDETAAAIVENGTSVRSSVVASQIDIHARFGGVVPELAGRAHVDALSPVVAQAMVEAGVEGSDIDVVAATWGPGLVGSLLVGVSAAKAYALAWNVPFVGVNHLEAHVFAAGLEDPNITYPHVCLMVSGAHTLLINIQSLGHYEVLGSTIDDAVGEAFDKVARYLGLGYPGGPAIDREAMDGDPEAVRFTRPMLGGGYDFSFSGIKSAVVRHVKANPELATADVAAGFQAAVVDVLVAKTRRAASEYGATGIVLAGGVAANSLLRERILDVCIADRLQAWLPGRDYCTDNAAMVAAAGYHVFGQTGSWPLDTGANPSLAFPG